VSVPQVGEIWRDTDPRGGPTIVVEHVCPNGCDQPGKRAAKVRRPHAHVKNWANPARPRTMLLTAFYTSTTRSKRGYEFVRGPVEK
jgi:hypothetical protein